MNQYPSLPWFLASQSLQVCAARHLEDAFVFCITSSYSAFKACLRNPHPDPSLRYVWDPTLEALQSISHLDLGPNSTSLSLLPLPLWPGLTWPGPQLVFNQGSMGQALYEGFSLHKHLGCGVLLPLETLRGGGRGAGGGVRLRQLTPRGQALGHWACLLLASAETSG